MLADRRYGHTAVRSESLSRSSQQALDTARKNAAEMRQQASRAMFSHATRGTGLSKGINAAGVKALISQLLSPSDDMHPHAVFSPRYVTEEHAQRVLDLLDSDGDGVWSWEEFQRACDLLLDGSGNPSSYRRSILMADDIVLQEALKARDDEVQELTDRIEAVHKEYEAVIEDLRQRLHERDEENVCIIDQANSDIGSLQQQLKVLRRQLLRARQGQGGAQDDNSKGSEAGGGGGGGGGGGDGADDDDGSNSDAASVTSVSSAPTPRRRSRLQPVPPVLRARGRRERKPIEQSVPKVPGSSEDALRAEVRKLQAQLSDRNLKVATLQSELADASSVILEFSDKISKKDQELFSLQRKNVELRSKLDEVHVQGLIRHLRTASLQPMGRSSAATQAPPAS